MDEPFPLMVWIFGAGGVSGSYDIDDLYLRRNAVDTKVSVVMMNYRLAPENPFPTGLNDCYNALKWIAEHTSLFSASIDRGFIMTGMCFGANLATALAFRARDDPFFEGRRPTGLGLQAPLLLHPELCPEKYESELKSRVTHKTARLMNMERLAKLATLYGAPLEHPEFSIILNEDYTNLPPTYVQVCGADPLRDEGRLLIKLLNQSGVETKIDEYPGLPHAGNRFFPEAQISKDWHNDWEEGIQWLVKLARPEENKTSDESL
ncbi:unnamed protein product [Somion occarium]|uniref:Alpha/beta hydrolase fold-3 domain-containing protein n=1 Tax=Somion occarium TaxID=3059160 RepID=A0ABP1E8Z6_9APHY